MGTDTDIRLRSQLDANQQHREQMCRAILEIDPKYSEVRPRHPRGGPDGGRDIEAKFETASTCFGAVGFANGANDSKEQKNILRKKFSDDLMSAVKANPKLAAFVFLTNVCFTMTEQQEMRQEAKSKGVTHCDIFDRERIRIELDSPSGFFVRFQYLNIPLSEAEQASFLSKYGDKVQEVVSTGFQRVEKTLNRLLFFAESSDVLSEIFVKFTLTDDYPSNDIGHFRAFVSLHLKETKHEVFAIWFGSTDKSARFRDDISELNDYGSEPGIGAGIAGGQWEKRVRIDENTSEEEVEKSFNTWIPAGYSDERGRKTVQSIVVRYSHDPGLVRFGPRITLRDLNESFFLPVVNKSLAEKIKSIQVFANGYELANYGPDDIIIDTTFCDFEIPGNFSPDELSDPWVRIRWKNASMFFLEFREMTPRRTFEHQELSDRIGHLEID